MKRLDRMKETETKRSEQEIISHEIYPDFTVGPSSTQAIRKALDPNETNLGSKESEQSQEITTLPETVKTLEETFVASNESHSKPRDEIDTKQEELTELDQELIRQKLKHLLNSIRLGKLEEVKTQLNLGLDLNIKDSYGSTLLHHAAYFQQIAIVEFLLLMKANPIIANNYGQLPLHLAANTNNVKLINLFLKDPQGKFVPEYIVAVTKVDVDNCPASFYSDKNNKQLNDIFAKARQQAEKNNKKNETDSQSDQSQPQTKSALMARRNALDTDTSIRNEILTKEVKEKMIESYKKEEFETLLSLVKEKDSEKLLHYYLKHSFDPNIRDETGSTVLYHAIASIKEIENEKLAEDAKNEKRKEHIKAIKKLVTNAFNKAKTLVVNDFDETPLHIAAGTNNIELIKIILMDSTNQYISNAKAKNMAGGKPINYLNSKAESYEDLTALLQEAEAAAGNLYKKMTEELKSEQKTATNQANRQLLELLAQNCDQEVILKQITGFVETTKNTMLKNIENTILFEDEKSTLSSDAKKEFNRIAEEITKQIKDLSIEAPTPHI